MGSSIQEMYNNIKRLFTDDTFFYGTLIVLASVTSFGLGRWSVVDVTDSKPVNTIQMQASLPATHLGPVQAPTSTQVTLPVATKVEQKYVASKKGTKYHLLWCAGAKSIKEENKIYFASKEEAGKAGYSPASNCKGI